MSRLRITAFVVMAVAGVCIVLHENPRIPDVVATDAKAMVGVKPDPITQEQREAARRFAKGQPVIDHAEIHFSHTFMAPENPMSIADMAAYSSIAMSQAWNGTLSILNQAVEAGESYTDSVYLGTLGCSLTIEKYLHTGVTGVSQITHGDPVGSSVGDPPYPGCEWVGFYFLFRSTLTGPDNTETQYWAVWAYDGWYESLANDPPSGTIFCDDDNLTLTYMFSVSNMYPKGQRTADTLTTRQPMDYTDFSSSHSWAADEDSIVTASVTGPGSYTTSVEGALGASGEIDLGISPFVYSMSFDVNYFGASGVDYAGATIAWGGQDAGTDNLSLWYSASEQAADRAPDQSSSATKHWSRYEADADAQKVHVYSPSDGEIRVRREGTGVTAKSHGVWARSPVWGTVKEVPGGHEDGTTYPGTTPQYTSNTFIDWEWDEGASAWASYLEKWTGDFSYYHQYRSWLFQHEWQRLLSASAVEIYQTNEWRAANGEAVGELTVSQNDRQLGVCLPWLDASDWKGEPWTENLLSIAHAASVNINDPPGETRESLWVGSGGVTVNPADNDEWSVANGSSAPKVGRSLLTRKWLRLDRLSGGYNEGDEYYQDWPIMDKANLPIGTTLDDPDWHDSGAGGIDVEDVTHWADYAYLTLNITAPASGTITLVVSYSVAAISDPCYTCAGSRWEEFEYTRTYHTATYSVDVTSGTHTYLIDLCLPSQKFIPSYTYRMGTVDSLQFSLPANSSGSPQVWTLNSLSLAHDTGEGVRTEPTYHVWFKYKRAWDWLNTDWNGISAIVDGKDALQLDYGYDSSYGKTRHEHGMLYIQRSEHCPGSAATTRLDSLKTIARLVDEIGYQEGWTATDNLTVDSSANKDADGNRLASALYWFDLRQNHEWSFATSQDIDGAVCVGTFGLLAGIEQHWYTYNVPRGRGHGIITSTDGTQRQRSITDAARLYRLADGGSSWQFVESLDTDEHGRFRTSPLLEDGYSYQLEYEGSVWTVANREYTTVSPQLDQYTPIHPHLADGYITDVHLWFVSDGNIYHKRKPTAAMVFQAPVCITSGYYPCGDVLPSGELLMAYQTPASQIAFKRSLKAGTIWEDTGVSVQGKYPILQQFNGIQYLVAYYSGIGQVIRRSQTRFSTLLTYNGATSALISAQTNAERVAFIKVDGDGNAMACAVPSGNSIRMYRSVNDGETWVQTI